MLPPAGYTVEATKGSTDTSNRDGFRTIDLGYALGLSVQEMSGLLLGLRYSGSLTRIRAGNAAAIIGARNSAFHSYVGYVFSSAK